GRRAELNRVRTAGTLVVLAVRSNRRLCDRPAREAGYGRRERNWSNEWSVSHQLTSLLRPIAPGEPTGLYGRMRNIGRRCDRGPKRRSQPYKDYVTFGDDASSLTQSTSTTVRSSLGGRPDQASIVVNRLSATACAGSPAADASVDRRRSIPNKSSSAFAAS